MKKPAVDYSGFRLSRIREPQYAHLLLLLGWVGYGVLYILTERLIPADRCVPVHCWLDDRIPFCEVFLIPYVFWYALIAFSLRYFLLYNVSGFKRLQIYLIVIQIVAVLVCILFPNRQDLRPMVFPRENLLTRGVALLYAVDTNTGVCPSLHVAVSVGLASAWIRERSVSIGWKIFITITAALICLSTVFLKQHSVVDAAAAVPVCLLAEWLVYHSKWQVRI